MFCVLVEKYSENEFSLLTSRKNVHDGMWESILRTLRCVLSSVSRFVYTRPTLNRPFIGNKINKAVEETCLSVVCVCVTVCYWLYSQFTYVFTSQLP